ncbi:hypothetical protein [Marispirochaeta sp.]|uniref:hypothetical protein n=1 Tax=Marispirochaeta sp. TaxID=2038653 RepID=UPI0029C81F2A|nr:hypothetical protein [Marispirochaeta sp.]
MNIETASGHTVQNVKAEELHEALAGLNEENNFLILTDGDDYIQCAISGSGSGFFAEYQDTSGHYGSDDGLSSETIEKLFTAYLSRSGEWRGLVSWEAVSDSGGQKQSAGARENTGSFTDSLKQDLSPGKLFDSVKRKVSREISRGVSRKTSGTVGRLVRKFFK